MNPVAIQAARSNRQSERDPALRVFVSEYICGGAWPEEVFDSSLVAEGRTMLVSLLRDLLRPGGGFFGKNIAEAGHRNALIENQPAAHRSDARHSPDVLNSVTVCTTWDDRLGDFPWSEINADVLKRLTLLPVSRSTGAPPETELELFRREAAAADAVFVIAPEFFGVLESRTREVERLADGRLVGCSSAAVRLCADKLELAAFLQSVGVPTIDTHVFDPRQPAVDWPYPVVIKPRDGAGSILTCRVDTNSQLNDVASRLRSGNSGFEFIQQPFVDGRSLTGAARISGSPSGRVISVLETGEQRLSSDGRFQYRGCDVPGTVTQRDHEVTMQLIRQCCERIPGLSGYAGFDLIATSDDVYLVEINPRLTTSWTARQNPAREAAQ